MVATFAAQQINDPHHGTTNQQRGKMSPADEYRGRGQKINVPNVTLRQ